jgi:HlyD family secretion protein
VLLGGCGEGNPSGPIQGYVEGEFLRIASPIAGRLVALEVTRGDRPQKGQALFTLDTENEAAAKQEAAERVQRAEAQLANLRKGRRPPEIAAIEAQLAQARAAFRLSEANLKRQEQLVAARFIAPERMDEARSAFARDRARVAELAAQLQTAKLPARPDEIAAAQAEVDAARAALAQADWRLTQKSVAAPQAGVVNDTFFVPGEWVPAGAPVVSLLPPANLKLRFFVPQERLPGLALGKEVRAACDGCGEPFAASVTFIAAQAEFTPPVIYSRENRAKLVFLVEARPEPARAGRLHPGQPVDVRF